MNRKDDLLFQPGWLFLDVGTVWFCSCCPRSELNLPATVPPVEITPVGPGVTEAVGIPVTGESEPVWIEILGFYGLIGLAALSLILALLSFVNKATAPYRKA